MKRGSYKTWARRTTQDCRRQASETTEQSSRHKTLLADNTKRLISGDGRLMLTTFDCHQDSSLIAAMVKSSYLDIKWESQNPECLIS